MGRLDIDLAPPSARRTLWRVTRPAWLLLVLGTGLCLGAAWAWQRQASTMAGQRAELAGLQARLAARQRGVPQQPVMQVPEARALAVRAVVQQLNLPWDGLLDALEQADTSTVAVLDLAPLPRLRLLKVVAEARDTAAMLAYLQRLGDQPAMDGVRLLKHEHVDQDTAQPVRFEFEAGWLLETP